MSQQDGQVPDDGRSARGGGTPHGAWPESGPASEVPAPGVAAPAQPPRPGRATTQPIDAGDHQRTTIMPTQHPPSGAGSGFAHPGQGAPQPPAWNPGFEGMPHPTQVPPGGFVPPQSSAAMPTSQAVAGHPTQGFGQPGFIPTGPAAPPPHGFVPSGQAPAGFVPTAAGAPGFVPGALAMPAAAPGPGVMQLRPQGVGDVLDVAFKVIRGNPGGSIGTTVLGGLIGTLVFVAVAVLSSRTSDASGRSVDGAVLLTFLAGALAGLSFMVPAAGLVHVFGQAVLGRRASAAASLRVGLRRSPHLLAIAVMMAAGTGLVVGLPIGVVVALGGEHTSAVPVVLVIIIAGLALAFVGIRICFATVVVVLEGAGPIRAIRRSWVLTRGRFWRTLGILLLTQIVISIISYIVQTILALLVVLILGVALTGSNGGSGAPALGALIGFGVVAGALSIMMMALVYPYLTNVLGGLYVDARIRDEGLATQLMQLPTQQAQGVTLTKGDLDFPKPQALPLSGTPQQPWPRHR